MKTALRTEQPSRVGTDGACLARIHTNAWVDAHFLGAQPHGQQRHLQALLRGGPNGLRWGLRPQTPLGTPPPAPQTQAPLRWLLDAKNPNTDGQTPTPHTH